MTVGVDVSKDTLSVAAKDGSESTIDNCASAINKLLSKLGTDDIVAMEATGDYHKMLADKAYAQGLTVFVFNPKDVKRFASAISPRAKTDKIDARVIALFAELGNHRPYKPAPPVADRIRKLARTRVRFVVDRVAAAEQLKHAPDDLPYFAPAMAGLHSSIHALKSQVVALAKTLPQFAALDAVPGFGELTTAYILALLASATFARSDSFVAFIGLDVKVKQSGKRQGRMCLTKRGDPEARRLLYLAAHAAARQTGPFQDIYHRCLANGHTKKEAAVCVARKLARIAWALYTKNDTYTSTRVLNQPIPKILHETAPQLTISHRPANLVDKQIANKAMALLKAGHFRNNHQCAKPAPNRL
jgi:transposase